MNHTRLVAGILLAAAGTPCGGASPVVRGFAVPAPTSVPYTYCIAYLPDPDKPTFLSALKASPPDLFHLGYHIPFKGALGPTYGHQLFSDDILPPDHIPREVERIQRLVRDMRAAGVRRLIPYVYTMAFFGNPDRRTGFFRFYDHWDEYKAFGLGPKPAADPMLWSQEPGPQPLGGGPPDVWHYHPCINHPAWREYLDLVVRQLADVGYDGMFFDVNTLECSCPHCQEKFDIYLLKKYGRAGLREAFGTDDHRRLDLSTIYRDFEETILGTFKTHLGDIWNERNLSKVLGAQRPTDVTLEEDWRLLRCYMQGSAAEFPPAEGFADYLVKRFGGNTVDGVADKARRDFVQTILRRCFHEFLEDRKLAALLEAKFGSPDIRRRCRSKARDMLLWVETQRFWCDSMASLFGHLKNVGRAAFAARGRQDDFYTVANLGSMANVDALNKRRVDGIDLVRWAPTADMQMFEEMPQPGMLESGVIFSNVFAFRWAMGAGTRAGTLLYKVSTDRAADLAHAEVAAGGGGAFIQPGLDGPESRRRWKQFFTDHAELWDGGTSWARVGLLFWSDQVFYEWPEHLAMAHRLVRVLAETQVPFDIVTEENPGDLRSYELVIAPMLRYLDDARIERLLEYVRRGGRLVVIEPFGTEDTWARTRSADPLGKVIRSGGDLQSAPYGAGRLLRLGPQAAPARRSDLWCLMEERANAFARARDYLNETRRADQRQGTDLGSEFIKRIEEASGVRLRWCPPGTDPGVYVHAYRLPPGQGRPERLVVHAVNYHLPIVLERGAGDADDPTWSPVTTAGKPVPALNLRITVPLPEALGVKQVGSRSPTDVAAPVKWSVEGRRAVLTVDRLEIYQALVVDLGA